MNGTVVPEAPRATLAPWITQVSPQPNPGTIRGAARSLNRKAQNATNTRNHLNPGSLARARTLIHDCATLPHSGLRRSSPMQLNY